MKSHSQKELVNLTLREVSRVESAREGRIQSWIESDEVAAEAAHMQIQLRQAVVFALRHELSGVDPRFESLTDGDVRRMNDALPPEMWQR